MIFRFCKILLLLPAIIIACEPKDPEARSRSKPSGQTEEIEGYIADKSAKAEPGKETKIILQTTTLIVPATGLQQPATVDLRVLAKVPEREPLVALGDPKGDVVEVAFYDETSLEVFGPDLILESYSLSQQLENVSNTADIKYAAISNPGTESESIQLITDVTIEDGVALINLNALKASLLLQATHILLYAVEVGSDKIPAIEIILIDNASSIQTAGGNKVVTTVTNPGSTDDNGDAASSGEWTWRAMSTVNAPAARFGHSAIWTGDKLVIWGGGDGAKAFSDGKIYDPANDEWTDLPGTTYLSGRYYHSAVWTGTRMHVYGGNDYYFEDFSYAKNNGDVYDWASQAWIGETTDIQRNYDHQGAVAFRHLGYWTGQDVIYFPLYSQQTYFCSLFDEQNGFDDNCSSSQPEFNGNAKSVWTGSQLVIWGAKDEGVGEHVAIRNSDGSWIQRPAAIATLMGHVMTWADTGFYVWSGKKEFTFDPPEDAGFFYSLADDQWYPLPTENAPGPRMDHQAVWTGTEWVVWGGCFESVETSVCYNSGSSYDPASQQWTPLPTDQAPSARFDFTMTKAGGKILVWGGRELNEGGLEYIEAMSTGAILERP